MLMSHHVRVSHETVRKSTMPGTSIDEEKLKVAKVVIGERIRRRWTQAALARRLGVTQQQVSKIENGDFDNLAALQKTPAMLGYQVRVSAEKRVPLTNGPRIRHA